MVKHGQSKGRMLSQFGLVPTKTAVEAQLKARASQNQTSFFFCTHNSSKSTEEQQTIHAGFFPRASRNFLAAFTGNKIKYISPQVRDRSELMHWAHRRLDRSRCFRAQNRPICNRLRVTGLFVPLVSRDS